MTIATFFHNLFHSAPVVEAEAEIKDGVALVAKYLHPLGRTLGDFITKVGVPVAEQLGAKMAEAALAAALAAHAEPEQRASIAGQAAMAAGKNFLVSVSVPPEQDAIQALHTLATSTVAGIPAPVAADAPPVPTAPVSAPPV